MVFFKRKDGQSVPFKKIKTKSGYVDLTNRLEKQQSKIRRLSEPSSSSDEIVDLSSMGVDNVHKEEQPKSKTYSNPFSFFGGSSNASEIQESNEDAKVERKKRLNDILRKLTSRMDEQEKEIYQLKQKLEILERKQKLDY